ncbi:L,D-transpeptidase family protein [Methylovirgula sp. 4M-Z18]|uniref:L,D-transpeptidase family protein n=1 Tax=Methylovirgula sp. 4M-Z18 TaxID=2293567 RepID=UPI001FE08AE5|nr:murein L,D-transpeptidase family protein [Methylovirgula sp. 4M-Z18]
MRCSLSWGVRAASIAFTGLAIAGYLHLDAAHLQKSRQAVALPERPHIAPVQLAADNTPSVIAVPAREPNLPPLPLSKFELDTPEQIAAAPSVPPARPVDLTPSNLLANAQPTHEEAVPLPPARPVLASLELPPLPVPNPFRTLERRASVTPPAPAAPVAAQPAPSATVMAYAPQPPVAAAPSIFQSLTSSLRVAEPPTLGAPVAIRIFKEEKQLELWTERDGRYSLYKSFPICQMSGGLGPKQKEADYQSPEGFYAVSASQLQPNSNYFKAFNIGYPNAVDRQNGRSGGLIMVHGNCVSIGCFAMTDKGIAEIYSFVEAAIRHGQKDVPVEIYPFRMTSYNISMHSFSSPWGGFWRELQVGYDMFNQTGRPARAMACNGHYRFGSEASAGCTPVAGWNVRVAAQY